MEILGRPWGALGETLGDHGRSPWRPLGPKMSSRSPPGSSRRLWSSRNHFKLSWGGQCVQTISFYSKICVLGIHDVCHVCDVCGPGSAVETPLPHAPGVRMTVVELIPSNDKNGLGLVYVKKYLLPGMLQTAASSFCDRDSVLSSRAFCIHASRASCISHEGVGT